MGKGLVVTPFWAKKNKNETFLILLIPEKFKDDNNWTGITISYYTFTDCPKLWRKKFEYFCKNPKRVGLLFLIKGLEGI